MTDRQKLFHLQSTWENLLIGLLHDRHLMNMEQKYNLIVVGYSDLFFWVWGNVDESLDLWLEFLTEMFPVKITLSSSSSSSSPSSNNFAECRAAIHGTVAEPAHLGSADYDHYNFYYPTSVHLFNIQKTSIKHLLCARLHHV